MKNKGMSKFNVGDRVIAQDGEVGIVTSKKHLPDYPITVRMDDWNGRHVRTYTEDGFQYIDDPNHWIRHLTKLDKALK